MSRSIVGVVGAGPVGALVALELAHHGLDVVLLEARSEISWTSRAICISRRSMEILDRAGIGEAFARKGLPWSKGRTFHRDQLVFRLDLPHSAGDRHAPFINLQQCYTEQFLVEAIDALPHGPDLRWGHGVKGIKQHRDRVQVDVQSVEGDYSLDVDWLVAADGARSIVRSSLGLSMKGTSYEGRYLISDIRVSGVEWPVERRVWFDAPANPGSTVILHIQPDEMWRVDMQLREDEHPEIALADEQLIPRLQAHLDMIGMRGPWQLLWKSIYRAHSLSLDTYRHGRVLFAGDAAHLVPIFGVRGLNSGFDDGHNLAWKLAMVARGEAPATLLDSYSAERRRATAENIANADKSTWFMSPPSAGFRRMRDAALILAHQHSWARELINPRQSSFHVYDSSSVVLYDDAPEVGVRPGAPIPNLPCRGTHLQLLLPSIGFAALLFEAYLSADAADKAEDDCASLGIAVIKIGEDEGPVADRFAAQRFPLYVIRPDEHVAARLRPGDLGRLPDAYKIAGGQCAQAEAPAGDVCAASPIENIYEALSLAIDRSDDSNDPAALERIALTLANALGDAVGVRELIDEAMSPADSRLQGDRE